MSVERAVVGLDYADQRYYASSLGRFNSPDPYKPSADIKDPSTWNRYPYVSDDPVNGSDPTGLCTIAGTWYQDGAPPCPDVTYINVSGDSAPPVGGGQSRKPNNDPNWEGNWDRKVHETNDEATTKPGILNAVFKCGAQVLGLDTLTGFGLTVAGLPILPAAGKFAGATQGTSVASSILSDLLPQVLDSAVWAPTIANPFATSKVLGRVLGRWIPVLGEAMLAYDAYKFADCLINTPPTPPTSSAGQSGQLP